MTRPGWRGYRALLRNAVISSAAPYGYTSTTSTIRVPATRAAGRAPTTVDALLMAVPGMISRGHVFYAGDDSGFSTGTTAPVNGELAID